MVFRSLHWRDYAIEAWGLATFMSVAGVVAVVLANAPPPLGRWLDPDGSARAFRHRHGHHGDAIAYALAQVVEGALGFFLLAVLIGTPLNAAPVHAIVTRPGTGGTAVAFIAETTISFVLMSAALSVSNASNPLRVRTASVRYSIARKRCYSGTLSAVVH